MDSPATTSATTSATQDLSTPLLLPIDRPYPTIRELLSHAPDANQSIDAIQDRVSKILMLAPLLMNTAHLGNTDMKLAVARPDGFSVSVDLHREVLVRRSKFFADKLPGSELQEFTLMIREGDPLLEFYVEALVLMYSEDLKTKLERHDVYKILKLLKACARLSFDDGVTACLEYLGEIPWSEEEEKKVVSMLTKLHLHNFEPVVLERVVPEPLTSSKADDIFLKMSTAILKAKNDRSREAMQATICGLIRKEHSENRIGVSKDTLYSVCRRFLSNLLLSLPDTICLDENTEEAGLLMSEIARKSDNVEWIIGILIERRISEEFVQLWADQKEFALTYSKTPSMFKHHLSKIAAQVCAGIGGGRILVTKETRYSLLSTWFEFLCDDFASMTFKLMDKKQVEEGLGNMILTLPIEQQEEVMLKWSDIDLNKEDGCPNLQRAFEVWWERFSTKHKTEQPSTDN